MSKKEIQNEKWIIWWIYGNSSQSNKCKCAQDKINFWKGEIIRDKIWAIQIYWKPAAILIISSTTSNIIKFYYNKMANRNSPQSPPLREQVPNNPRLGIEIPTGLPDHLSEQEMTPSPVAPDEKKTNFLGLYYRVDVEGLNDWAVVTSFMKGSIEFVVQEPEITDDFKQFWIIKNGSNWEKGFRVTRRWQLSTYIH